MSSTHAIEPKPLRIALTADLHFGTREAVDRDVTFPLVARLYEKPPDVLILAGDIGAGDEFETCLKLFASLPSTKALVPGNHDVWVRATDSRGDSLTVYDEVLPRIASDYGFHYLDHGPLLLPDSDLAIVGAMNWYDYSWAMDRLPQVVPDWEERLRTKRFSRGRHNDANFVRWPFDDGGFTTRSVDTLSGHLTNALSQVASAIVITHHPPFRALNFPRINREDPDGLLWEAFSGNSRMEELLSQWQSRIPFAFCGHTHRARDGTLGSIRGHNIGGDYHFKRLLWLDWPTGTVTAETFGEP